MVFDELIVRSLAGGEVGDGGERLKADQAKPAVRVMAELSPLSAEQK